MATQKILVCSVYIFRKIKFLFQNRFNLGCSVGNSVAKCYFLYTSTQRVPQVKAVF